MKISFPRIGIYTEVGVKFFKKLGLEVIEPNPVGKKLIEKGVLFSPEMMCFPYKVVLSSFIDALERGADTLIMYNSQGFCRYRCYYVMAEMALRELGYKFKMVVPKAKNLFSWIFKIAPEINKFNLIKIVKETWEDIKEVEKRDKENNKGDIKIGIVGEFYTCIEPSANFNLVQKLRNYGAQVDIGMNVSEFIRHGLKFDRIEKWKERKIAKKLLKGEMIAGHGFDSIVNSIYFIRKGYDGIILAMPLTCMPECVAEPFIKKICDENNIPFMVLRFDENVSEVNIDNRINAFCELIRRKKWRNLHLV
ncbi:MAG: acyl-CoA dehydratase activase-related protein [Candidatus Omnitrophica bacterium]|nr:acyl-CoA dehydratase activase-related protein [Candidatus Omnitrophota bacterium]MCM8807000.1 acyl-CoA dehydratase activase-related protein [Candidatus Omnitrophota bacterium]